MCRAVLSISFFVRLLLLTVLALAPASAQDAPNISIEQPVGEVLPDPGLVRFGYVPTGGPYADREFTIRNTGTADLSGLLVTIDGVHAANFTVQAQPAPILSPGGTVTFTVRCIPGGGENNATVRVASNMSGALSSYDIDLTGCGTYQAALSGTKSVGPTGDFPSLTAVVQAVQSRGLNGPLLLELQAAYDGSVENSSVPVTIGDMNTTAVNTLTIRPQAGATNLRISGSSYATLDLSGVRHLTINGRPGGVGTAKELTITAAGTGAAVRFIGDASYNRLQYLNLEGGSISTGTGVVAFAGTLTAWGNRYNVVDHCDIHDRAGTTPAVGVYSGGRAIGTLAQFNSNNTVSSCNIYNFHHSSAALGAGVRVNEGSTDWTITGNSFYQTATRTGSSSASISYGIDIANTGGNYVITGNYVGGDSPLALVTTQKWTMQSTSDTRFRGISLNVTGTAPSSIQGNVIRQMAWGMANSAAAPAPRELPATPSTASWIGILTQAGAADVGSVSGNIIGDDTSTGSITLATTGTGATAVGISSASRDKVVIASNTVGSVTAKGSAESISANVVGILIVASTISTQGTTIQNNLLGSQTTANSLNAETSATGPPQSVNGIITYSRGPTTIAGNTVANLNNNSEGHGFGHSARGILACIGVNTITGNTVRNLSTASRNSEFFGSGVSICGIGLEATDPGQRVAENVVHTLTNTNLNVGSQMRVVGIYYLGGPSGLIAGNQVHSLGVSAFQVDPVITGMMFLNGSFTAQNNMVSIGLKADGQTSARAAYCIGIYDSSSDTGRVFRHNTVYLNGPQTNGNETYAFFTSGKGRDVRNNIFANCRTNVGSSNLVKHYAIGCGSTSELTASNNLLYATGGSPLGYFNEADRATLADWQTATGQDANSLSVLPQFVAPDAAGTAGDLHLLPGSPAIGAGMTLPGVTDDFDHDMRVASPPAIGADEPVAADNALLYSLAVSPGTLSPAFATSTTGYTAGPFANQVSSVNVTPRSISGAATLRINGALIGQRGETVSVPLTPGENTLTVRVTAPDTPSFLDYTIAVHRNTLFEDWTIATSSSLDPVATGPNSLPGLQNYAFGLDPARRDLPGPVFSGNVITPGVPSCLILDGIPTAVWVRRKDSSTSGLAYDVQFSADLTTWHSSAALPAVLADNGLYQVMALGFPSLGNGVPTNSFRVRVSLP